MGQTKVFLKLPAAVQMLEDARAASLRPVASRIQARARASAQLKRFGRLKRAAGRLQGWLRAAQAARAYRASLRRIARILVRPAARFSSSSCCADATLPLALLFGGGRGCGFRRRRARAPVLSSFLVCLLIS